MQKGLLITSTNDQILLDEPIVLLNAQPSARLELIYQQFDYFEREKNDETHFCLFQVQLQILSF